MHKKTIKFICLNCGKEVEFLLSRQSVHKFCSQACRNEFLGKKTIIFTCENCGKTKEVYKNPNSQYRYCSRECYLKVRTKDTIYIVCEYCGKTRAVNKADVDRGKYKEYCSQKCRSAVVGRKNNQRKGGTWKVKRRVALERDKNLCRLCNTNEATDVHHIIPFKDFEFGEEAHKISNLISLCKSCHTLTYCHEYEFIGIFKRILEGESNG